MYAELLAEALEAHLTPALTALGFTTTGRRAWTAQRLQVRAILDSKANDPYRGGAFTLEFEVSDDGRFEEKLAGRVRIEQLLDEGQREAFLGRRNHVAENLEAPPGTHLEAIPASVRAEYLKPFREAEELEKRFWMRFRTAEDLVAWCDLIVSTLPCLIERVRTLTANELYLGRRLQWDRSSD